MISIGKTLVIIGLLIWIGVTTKKWYSDTSTRPQWLVSFLVIFFPVHYDIMTGMIPHPDSNVTTIVDTSSKTANTCASNCSTLYGCNGFIFQKSTTTCSQVTNDFGLNIMVPNTDYDTYIRQDKNHPKYGFLHRADPSDYAFSSNLVNQRLGSILSVTDPYKLANTCIQQASSNCVGFSFNSSTSNAWLVNDVSNIESTSNTVSYQYTLLTASSWPTSL